MKSRKKTTALLFVCSLFFLLAIFPTTRNIFLSYSKAGKEQLMLFFSNQIADDFLFLEINLKKSEGGEYEVNLSLEDNQGNGVGDAFITVYDSNSWHTIYSFSILRTNSIGECGFKLKEGQYDLNIGSSDSPQSLLNETPFGFLLSINTETESQIKRRIPLYLVNVNFKNFPDNYKYKIETQYERSNGFQAWSQMIAKSTKDRQQKVLLGSGKATLNFDTEGFDPEHSQAFVLTTDRFDPEKKVNLEFIFEQLDRFKILLSNASAGWIKFKKDSLSPDSQAPYFNEPIEIYTNHDSVILDRVYVGLDRCNTYLTNKETASPQEIERAMRGFCKNTSFSYRLCSDSRYKVQQINIDNNRKIEEIHPPSRLELSTKIDEVKQGENLAIYFKILNDQDYEFEEIGVHQIWDKSIRPQLVVLKQEEEVERFDFWSSDYFQGKGIKGVVKKICLNPGDYVLKAWYPTGVWNNNVLLEDEINIKVIAGESCTKPMSDSPMNANQLKYDSWRQLYVDRDFLADQSSGFLMTYPSYQKDEGVNFDLSDYEKSTISECEQIAKVINETTVSIELTEQNTLNLESHKKFSSCLRDFDRDYGPKNFVLIDSLPNLIFSTNQFYMYYHYYLLLHQHPQTKVGLVVNSFDRFFYGFADFFIYNPTDPRYSLSEEELRNWLDSYENLIDDNIPIYFDS